MAGSGNFAFASIKRRQFCNDGENIYRSPDIDRKNLVCQLEKLFPNHKFLFLPWNRSWTKPPVNLFIQRRLPKTFEGFGGDNEDFWRPPQNASTFFRGLKTAWKKCGTEDAVFPFPAHLFTERPREKPFWDRLFWLLSKKKYFCIRKISRLPCIPYYLAGWTGMGQVTAKRT